MRLIIDVHSSKDYPADTLSNFFPHRFMLDGQDISCMEAYLQSMKCPDPAYQKTICLMEARQAKALGQTYHWQQTGMLYWQGKSFSRFRFEYWRLLFRAYGKLCDVPAFRQAIVHSGHSILRHSVGKWFRKDTCLTTWEFLFLLYWCRWVVQKRKRLESVQDGGEQ